MNDLVLNNLSFPRVCDHKNCNFHRLCLKKDFDWHTFLRIYRLFSTIFLLQFRQKPKQEDQSLKESISFVVILTAKVQKKKEILVQKEGLNNVNFCLNRNTELLKNSLLNVF